MLKMDYLFFSRLGCLRFKHVKRVKIKRENRVGKKKKEIWNE